ncbi:MAG TPA: sodium:proton antiporter [Stellaceae bacterium]
MLAALLVAVFPAPASAAAAEGLDGAALGLGWVLPFAGLLLSIAILPAVAPSLWHRHFGKIAAGWALALLAPLSATQGGATVLHALWHTALLEYLPFIILLTTLYAITGGVRLSGTLHGTPGVNTAMLGIGTLLASVMGTTGAAMLVVRPLLRANRRRRHYRHVFVFLIILVGNLGGALTPLGDPPLYIGYLQGVPFFWPLVNLSLPMLLASGTLLALFFAVDSLMHRRSGRPEPDPLEEVGRLKLRGKRNLAMLAAAVAVVMASGTWRSGATVDILGVEAAPEALAGDAALVLLTLLALRFGRSEIRRINDFGWGPMVEVAILFAAIFATIIPVLAIVQAGEAGAASAIMPLLGSREAPNDAAYFWLTGILSAFLDNAPTYLLFFNFAGGDVAALTGPRVTTLTAISAGAVFFGALTYIGNAPNFMVRAIIEDSRLAMPNFFAYAVWAAALLLPLFGALTVIFFR